MNIFLLHHLTRKVRVPPLSVAPQIFSGCKPLSNPRGFSLSESLVFLLVEGTPLLFTSTLGSLEASFGLSSAFLFFVAGFSSAYVQKGWKVL